MELPEKPYKIITSDFIVGLPESDGYTAIMMITNRSTKHITIEPCTNDIDADGAAEILIRRVFSQTGLPEKMISNRGPLLRSRRAREGTLNLDTYT